MSRLQKRCHRRHDVFHRRTLRWNSVHTAMDEIPHIVFHSWIFQSFWAFPRCDESQNLKVVVFMKRDIIKEYLYRLSSTYLPSRLKTGTHRIIKAAECISVGFLCFGSMLLCVALFVSIAVRLRTLGAHAKQFRRSEMYANCRGGLSNSSFSVSSRSKIGDLAVPI